jgi:hypothetical protein
VRRRRLRRQRRARHRHLRRQRRARRQRRKRCPPNLTILATPPTRPSRAIQRPRRRYLRSRWERRHYPTLDCRSKRRCQPCSSHRRRRCHPRWIPRPRPDQRHPTLVGPSCPRRTSGSVFRSSKRAHSARRHQGPTTRTSEPIFVLAGFSS